MTKVHNCGVYQQILINFVYILFYFTCYLMQLMHFYRYSYAFTLYLIEIEKLLLNHLFFYIILHISIDTKLLNY